MKNVLDASNVHHFVKLDKLPVNSVTKFEYDTYDNSIVTLYLHKDRYGTRIIEHETVSTLSADIIHINPQNLACFVSLTYGVVNEYNESTNMWVYNVNELVIRKNYFNYLEHLNNFTHSIKVIRAGNNGFIAIDNAATKLITNSHKQFENITDMKQYISDIRTSVEQEFIQVVHNMYRLKTSNNVQ